MSIFKTALVTALLGSSSAAMAAPGVSVSAHADLSFAASTSPAVRDHRSYERPYSYQMPSSYAAHWLTLSGSMQLRGGMDTIRVEGRQSLSQLRLQATTGSTQIDRVTIRFLDGTYQTLRLRTLISATNPSVQLDIPTNHSGVESISIFGRGSWRSSYQVLGQARFDRPAPRPIVSFTGTYTSAYGDVFLEQRGNRIFGEYPGKQGRIEGYVTNGIAMVNWTQPDSAGRATFSLGANGKLEGTWGTGTSANNAGEWDLYRANR